MRRAISGYDVTTGKLRVTIDGKPPLFLIDVAQFLKNVTDGTWTAAANAIVMEYVAVNGHDQSFGFLQVTTRGGNIPTPEPATLGILGFGIVGLAAVRRRQPKGTI